MTTTGLVSFESEARWSSVHTIITTMSRRIYMLERQIDFITRTLAAHDIYIYIYAFVT